MWKLLYLLFGLLFLDDAYKIELMEGVLMQFFI